MPWQGSRWVQPPLALDEKKLVRKVRQKKRSVWHRQREIEAARRLARIEELELAQDRRWRWREKYRKTRGKCRLCGETASVYGDPENDLWQLRRLGLPDEFWEMSEVCGDCWMGICDHFRRRAVQSRKDRGLLWVRDLDHRIDQADLVSCIAWFLAHPPKWLRALCHFHGNTQ